MMAQFPSTTAADGIWTLKKVRRAILGENWPQYFPPDQYWANTVLLLQGNGTASGDNTNLTDSSSNNHSITTNGNVFEGTFSPFSKDDGDWGVYFNGSSKLNIADSADFTFAGAFTVEAWVYWTSTSTASTGYQTIIGGHNATASTWGMYVKYSNSYASFYVNGTLVETTTAVPRNEWVHIAATRDSSNVVKVFINGVDGTTAPTVSGTIETPSGGLNIGRDLDTNDYFLGYISNVRVLKGTSQYTSNFTPSSSSFTAITNTSLLACQSNYFKDNSSSDHSISVSAGSPKVDAFSPFGRTDSYSASTHGGSVTTTGASREGFYIATDTTLDITTDGSVDCWYYYVPDGSSAYPQVWMNKTNGQVSPAFSSIYITNSNNLLALYLNSGNVITGTITPYQWTHINFEIVSGTAYLHLNGVNQGSASNKSLTAGEAWNFLERVSGSLSGSYPSKSYIAYPRIIKGSTAFSAGSSDFSVPTSPTTSGSEAFLARTHGADIIDGTGFNNVRLVGNTTINDTTKKYGDGSLQFDGTGDYLTIPASQLFAFGTGDFTIEFWGYFDSITNYDTIYIHDGASGSLQLFFVNGKLRANNNLVASILDTTTTISTGQWIHFALCRSGSTIKWYLDGTEDGSTTNSTNLGGGTTNLTIGSDPTNSRDIDGYIDDLRITKGIARYTANFTPPTAELPVFGE